MVLVNAPFRWLSGTGTAWPLMFSLWTVTVQVGFAAAPESVSTSPTSTLPTSTLSDALQAALHRADSVASGVTLHPLGSADSSPSWLAALPTVGFGHMDNEDTFGSTESELSLNLSLKSPQQRRIDQSLTGINRRAQELAQKLRKLQMSGFLREAAWEYKLASVRQQLARDKQQALEDFAKSRQALLEANAISAYPLFLLQKEIINVSLALSGYQQQCKRWQQRFEALAGLPVSAIALQEAPIDAQSLSIDRHPRVQVLALEFDQQRLEAEANSASTVPWELSFIGKELKEPGFSERQFGVSVEVPLSFLSFSRRSERSERQRAANTFLHQRDALYADIQSQWQQVLTTRQDLQLKQTQLTRSLALSEKMFTQLEALHLINELNPQDFIRLMLDKLKTQTELSINQYLLQRNNADLRQAAGIPL